MAMGLYDPAFATLACLYGRAARGPITGITLVAGFASTVGEGGLRGQERPPRPAAQAARRHAAGRPADQPDRSRFAADAQVQGPRIPPGLQRPRRWSVPA